MIPNKKNNKKKLTAAVRAAYEGHKSSTKKKNLFKKSYSIKMRCKKFHPDLG